MGAQVWCAEDPQLRYWIRIDPCRFERYKIFCLADGVEIVREWLDSVGFKDEYVTLKIPTPALPVPEAAAPVNAEKTAEKRGDTLTPIATIATGAAATAATSAAPTVSASGNASGGSPAGVERR